MQVHFGLAALQPEWPACVVCIGTFDGVHLGHQAVIGEAVRQARDMGIPSVLLTFDRHPAALLNPSKCPDAVATLAINLREFERIGVAVAIILAFDRALSQTSADEFYGSILRDSLRAERIVIGHDFAFGKNRQGTPEWLSERMRTTVVPPFAIEGHRVSSTDIRQAVAEGRIEDAARLLGRPFELSGVVVTGQKLGRTIGFPTINLARSSETVVPANGVYAGRAVTPVGVFAAAIGVGVRPAVGGGPRTVEAYLLGYPGDSLYGCSVSLTFERRLRDERDFPSLDELREQMQADVEKTSRVIKL